MQILEYLDDRNGAGGRVIDVELIPQVAERFKALADAGRLSLLAALQRGERSVGELVELTGRSQPNVSQQLASLAHAGLVGARREGTKTYYRIADATILRICDAVCESVVARARELRREAALVASRRRSRLAGAR
jgi:DNA-binding transcriptional ArsR family regulator